jgi:Kae1-associated kinase Bud32
MVDEAPAEAAPVSRGAEASLRRVEWLGFPALLKERDPKSYRPKALDERLRKERTRTEARLLSEVRKLGVRTPIVYDVDLSKGRLILEEIPGPTLKQLLDAHRDADPDILRVVRSFGVVLGRIHAAGISHGDLTSSNVLIPDGPGGAPALIDLSMGSKSAGVEELGIDIHLVEADLKALHPASAKLLAAFYEGYGEGNPLGAADVRKRAGEIRGRVRYA